MKDTCCKENFECCKSDKTEEMGICCAEESICCEDRSCYGDYPIERKEIWNPAPYQLEVEIDGNKFRFQSPTYREMENLGLELLASTFGRYNVDKIRKNLKKNEE